MGGMNVNPDTGRIDPVKAKDNVEIGKLQITNEVFPRLETATKRVMLVRSEDGETSLKVCGYIQYIFIAIAQFFGLMQNYNRDREDLADYVADLKQRQWDTREQAERYNDGDGIAAWIDFLANLREVVAMSDIDYGAMTDQDLLHIKVALLAKQLRAEGH